jgi:sugar phosphate isomerase/epimerase
MNRRGFLQASTAMTAAVGVNRLGAWVSGAEPLAKGAPNAEKLGWRLGCQAWSFNETTFYDAVDRTASLGLHFIEAFPGQKLSAEKPDKKFGEGLAADLRSEVRKRLSDKGVKLVSFGVGGFSKAIFDFAKEMGIENIVSEPPFDAFEVLDRLCEEYKLNVALHNHPKPSRYWDPDIVLKTVKDHSKRIGACCDTGHWLRSNIVPLDALKKLEGRIIEFHFKDLNEFGAKAHDVPWGTGKADVKGMLTEVKRQGIKPVFSVEYEYHYGTSLPEIAQCVQYFDKVAGELA